MNTTTSGVGVGRGGAAYGTARTTGTSQTVESKAAAPPARKGFGAGAAMIVLGLIGCWIVLSGSDGVLGAILFLALGGAGVGLLRAAARYNRDVWPDLKRTWDATFKCFRCGITFVAGGAT